MRLGLKMLVATLLVVVVPLATLNRYALQFFDRFCREMWEEEMIDTAVLIGRLWQTELNPVARQLLLDGHAEQSDMRLRWLDHQGVAIYDSGGAEDVRTLQGFEVKEALELRKYRARFQLNQSSGRMYYFSALPVEQPGSTEMLGVVHVVRHTGPITAAIIRMHDNQEIATWISGSAAGTLALIFAWLLTHRLRRLRGAARRYAASGDTAGFAMRGRDEVAQLAAEFTGMAETIERRQVYNRDFVRTTLHELKTPLTAMNGAAQILNRPDLAPEQRQRFAENVLYQSRRLQRLVEQLHELTELDVGARRPQVESVEFGGWVKACLERIQPGIETPVSLTMVTELPEVRMMADPMEQVMVNLLGNAVRYAPDGSPVEVRVLRMGDRIRLEVLDQGEGFAEADRSRVFDRFFSTVPPGGSLEYGSGLGLSLVQSVVEAHRGAVFAENREGGGACVGFELPVEQHSL